MDFGFLHCVKTPFSMAIILWRGKLLLGNWLSCVIWDIEGFHQILSRFKKRLLQGLKQAAEFRGKFVFRHERKKPAKSPQLLPEDYKLRCLYIKASSSLPLDSVQVMQRFSEAFDAVMSISRTSGFGQIYAHKQANLLQRIGLTLCKSQETLILNLSFLLLVLLKSTFSFHLLYSPLSSYKNRFSISHASCLGLCRWHVYAISYAPFSILAW